MVKKIIVARSADGAAAPGTIANAGANGAWDGVVVEHHRLVDLELPESTVPTHLVCLRLGPADAALAGDGGRGSRVYVGTTPTVYRRSRAGPPSSSGPRFPRTSHGPDPDEPNRPPAG